jgi:hypothetical protein
MIKSGAGLFLKMLNPPACAFSRVAVSDMVEIRIGAAL